MKLSVLFCLVLAAAATTGSARKVVLQYAQVINGAQSVPPNPVEGVGGSHVFFDTETFTISWIISFQGLTGPAIAAHFHGPAGSDQNAPVQIDIGAVSGLESPMIGSSQVTPEQGMQILAGEFYINVHTSVFPAGEIRGQMVDANLFSFGQLLSPLQENPPVLSDGHGTSHVFLDPASGTLSWILAWDDLTGPATLAHFHGDAPIGVNAAVQVNVGEISGLTSPAFGATVLTPSQVVGLLSGNWYLNVHTAANPGGEIRGQIQPSTPLFFAQTLNGISEVPPVQTSGSGVAHAFIDTVTSSVSWIITYRNLTGPSTLAHFHGPAPPGVNAGVQIDIAAAGGLNSPMSGIIDVTPEQARFFLEGLMYANVHTSSNPGGEVRGQMIRVAK